MALIIGDCTPWRKYRNKKGYGSRRYKGKTELAHRVAYVEHRGLEMEDIRGWMILHSCDNPPCVNPNHLFLGTQDDNMADMVAKGRWSSGNVKKTHCKHGHPFGGDNLYVSPSGVRRCRACMRARDRKRWGARRLAQNAARRERKRAGR